MKVVGLITEYNPFHKGHLYHIQESKKITGADYVVVVMSGNFLQRGTPALIDKYTRTKMALLNGADLVIEIPVCFATGSAEYFAGGAVSILNSLNIVDYICFGSECGDIKLLSDIADILSEEPDISCENLKTYLKSGLTYPQARTKALINYLQNNNTVDYDINYIKEVVSSPNNILGIEYIKALIKSHSSIKPYTITRKDSDYHDKSLKHEISSATAIRLCLLNCNPIESIRNNVPENVYEIMYDNYYKCFPVFENDFSLLLNYKLLISQSLINKYADVSNELTGRINNNLNAFTSFSEFSELIKTKQITLTRVNRAFIHIILNIYNYDFRLFVENGYSQYIRVLGFRKSSSKLLKLIKESAHIPIITRLSSADSTLSELGITMLSQDITATNIYNSVVSDKYRYTIKNDFLQGIITDE